MIPGKGHGTVETSFKPPNGILEEINYLGYSLGHMSLEKHVSSNISLTSQYHIVEIMFVSF